MYGMKKGDEWPIKFMRVAPPKKDAFIVSACNMTYARHVSYAWSLNGVESKSNRSTNMSEGDLLRRRRFACLGPLGLH